MQCYREHFPNKDMQISARKCQLLCMSCQCARRNFSLILFAYFGFTDVGWWCCCHAISYCSNLVCLCLFAWFWVWEKKLTTSSVPYKIHSKGFLWKSYWRITIRQRRKYLVWFNECKLKKTRFTNVNTIHRISVRCTKN